MKQANKVINIILVFYLCFHLCYSIVMMMNSLMNGLIWLAIFMLELGAVILGKRKWKIFLPLLAIMCVIQTCLSVGIMALGFDSGTENADTVLVLGYQLDDNEMTSTLKYRLDKTYQYAINNPNSHFVLCGGITRENTVSEAEVMKKYLLSKGIEETRMTCEDQSTDTIENIQNSLKYIDKQSNIIVLSSNYHVYRAKLICEKAGLEVKTLGSKAPIYLIPHQCLLEKISIAGLMAQ